MTAAPRRRLRLAALGFAHEANTFAVRRATLDDYHRAGILRGKALLDRHGKAATVMGGYLRSAEASGVEVVPLWYAETTPCGPVDSSAFEVLIDEMLMSLQGGGPWDGVLLCLHGAAVADGTPDADGHILHRVREVVGPSTPVGVTLDMHANISDQMVSASTVIVGYRTNPHIDGHLRGADTAELVVRAARSEIAISQSFLKIPAVINILRQGTSDQPMCTIIEEVEEALTTPGVLSASVFEGFPYADVPEMGMSAIVVTDGDFRLAEYLTGVLGRVVWANRHDLIGTAPTADAALRDASAAMGTTLLLDIGDNIGGGAEGSNTEILAEALRSRTESLLVILHDSEAVQICRQAGQNGKVDLRCGTPPIRLVGTVETIHDGRFYDRGVTHGGQQWFDAGPTAVLRLEQGPVVVLTSEATIASSISQLTSLDLSPRQFKVLTAKGVHSPLASYRPQVDNVTAVDTPGVTASSLNRLTYRRRRTPLFPFETDFTPSFAELTR